MIDIRSEQLITFTQAARLRPPSRAGRPTHPATIGRWARRGVRGHHLEAIRLGGTWYTSVEALQRFANLLSGGPASSESVPPHVQQRATDVDAELDRLGI